MVHRSRRLGLVAALVLAPALVAQVHASAIPPNAPRTGIVCDDGNTVGNTTTFDLVTKTGNIDTPDGNSVFMWSYANAAAPDNGAFQSPGPVLCVTAGRHVVVNLTNTLPEPSSIVFPGQDQAVTASGGAPGLMTTEAPAAGGTVSYGFDANQPGTYLYQSGSDVTKQIEMGLYGALVVRPTTAGQAYGAGTAYDPTREYLLLLADIDPALHQAVWSGSNYDPNTKRDRYFTINGRSFPDTIQDNGSGLLPHQPYGALVRIQPNTPATPNNPNSNLPALVRMVNVGSSNHPFHPHGNHTTQIAQDGREMARTEHFGETIASGQTMDFLLRWDDQDFWSPSNKLPVTQPNYRDLTFKDGNTFYAGSPYLGYKGTLPTGTVSQNICGEWYFPWHSHALNEFTNFDEGFGGMGTLLRVDPPGGCFSAPGSATIVQGALKSGSVGALATADTSYYQVNPKATTRTGGTTMSTTATTMTVASASGFPTTTGYYVRVGSEVMQVTGGAGTTTWSVARHTLGTTATTHASGQPVTALANDWYAEFTGVQAGSSNLTVTYTGRNCGSTTSTTCTAISSPLPQQTMRICNWTVAPAGCAAVTSPGWQTLPPAGVEVGSTDVTTTRTLSGIGTDYIGKGSHKGQVRVLVHTQRWTAPNPTTFSTWGNLMRLVYDAP